MVIKETKDAYGDFYLISDISQARIGILLLMIPIFVYVINDFEISGLSSVFYGLVGLRGFLLLFTILLVFYLSRVKNHGLYEKLVFAYTLFASICMLTIFATHPQDFDSQLILAVLSVFIYYLVIPNRFVYQTLPALVGTVGAAVLLVLFAGGLTTANLFSVLLILLVGVVIAASSAWQIQKYRQKRYREIAQRLKAENALMESEEKFRGLVESTSDWIWQVDENAVYTYSSPKIKDILGYEHQEIIGKTPFDLMPKDEAEKIGKIFKEIAKKKISFQGLENWNVHKDGHLVLLETNGIPILDKSGKLMGFRGIDRDVTERKKAELVQKDYQDRLKMAQHIAHLGSWEFHVKEDKALWSEELFSIFHLKPQTYGPNISEYRKFIHPDDDEAVNQTMTKLISEGHVGDVVSFDYRIVLNDQSVRVLHTERMIIELDEAGKVSKIMGIEQDITERKLIEQQLERYSKHLEELVEERTRRLEDAERLAAIGATAGMIGHDIRNPLQAIVSELYFARQAMAEMPKDMDTSETLESINIIQAQTDYITKIVSDLQDYAKPLKPELVEVDICQFIPDALRTIEIPDNIQTSVSCEERLVILFDPTFMRRILTNIVSNGIQAMPNGGKLNVKVFKRDNKATITVEDTGVGISEEVKSKIFSPLFTTKAKGQGFGLPVVKRLVEAQGGTISFESEVGKGAKFIVDLPMNHTRKS